MSRNTLIFLLITLFFLVIFVFSFWKKDSLLDSQPEDLRRSNYFAVGGIVPHHLLVSDIIADFFTRLVSQNPRTIILLTPNHYEKGDFKALSSLSDWQTPQGVVKADKELIKKFISLGLVEIDEQVVFGEHAVFDLVPFIKEYLPQASVSPLVLSKKMTLEEVETLAEELAPIVNEDVVLVAAVDFSHYLKASQAKENDIRTLELIRNFDYPKLLSLGSDFLDAPSCLAVLLATMKKTDKTQLEILHHSNSGELLNDDFAETTSYFSIRFY